MRSGQWEPDKRTNQGAAKKARQRFGHAFDNLVGGKTANLNFAAIYVQAIS